jgi:hypothetical protein
MSKNNASSMGRCNKPIEEIHNRWFEVKTLSSRVTITPANFKFQLYSLGKNLK